MSCATMAPSIFTVVVGILLASLLATITAQVTMPPENLCQSKSTCRSCVSTNVINAMENNRTCIFTLRRTGPQCVNIFVVSEDVLQVVYTIGGCGDYHRPPFLGKTDLRGEPCQDNQTCKARDIHAFCRPNTPPYDSTCHCESGYVTSTDHARCLEANVRLGGSCKENQQCSNPEKSVCVAGSNVCDCIPGLIPSDDLKRCLPIVNELATTKCEEDAQCQLGMPGSLSACALNEVKSKVCRCVTGVAVNSFRKNTCLLIAQYVGFPCESQVQCTAGLQHSRCFDGKCVCNQGYKSLFLESDHKWACGLAN